MCLMARASPIPTNRKSSTPCAMATSKPGIANFTSNPAYFSVGCRLFNNFGDNYTFLVAADGYKDAGFFPVKLAANVDMGVDLMLIPASNAFNFASATWAALGKSRPELKDLLAQGAASSADAATRYGNIMEDAGGAILACLLNITTAMHQVPLGQKTPFDYLKQAIWDRTGEFAMAQDRFFAWADVNLIKQLDQAVQNRSRYLPTRHSASILGQPAAISRSSSARPTSSSPFMKATSRISEAWTA